MIQYQGAYVEKAGSRTMRRLKIQVSCSKTKEARPYEELE